MAYCGKIIPGHGAVPQYFKLTVTVTEKFEPSDRITPSTSQRASANYLFSLKFNNSYCVQPQKNNKAIMSLN